MTAPAELLAEIERLASTPASAPAHGAAGLLRRLGSTATSEARTGAGVRDNRMAERASRSEVRSELRARSARLLRASGATRQHALAAALGVGQWAVSEFLTGDAHVPLAVLLVVGDAEFEALVEAARVERERR